ncbi:MAG: hypothetical protein E7447_02945 [Ruminococcaceae bacterium]|nr:hypothetical protein [Oscillospiraceae bacterium]
MTQRVPVQNGQQSVNPRRKQTQKWYMTRKEKITVACLASVTAVLLIAAFVMIYSMVAVPSDDGRILKGVEAAGVKLGGMTVEEAIDALEAAVGDKYSTQSMYVEVLGERIRLSPAYTGADLDFRAVAEAAYNYGRTGSRSEREQAKNYALANSVSIPLTDHLNLDFDYIQSQINELGAKFSTSLTQTEFTLTGAKPPVPAVGPVVDTNKGHQTLTIKLGTPEYDLDIRKLYEQVLECYNIGTFEVVGDCPVRQPESLEAELMSYYNDLCMEPIDARTDPLTSEVIPEVYGYGFHLNEVKDRIAKAAPGETITIQLRYLEPKITQELINNTRFKDTLGSYNISLGTDEAWNKNVSTACLALNGLFLKAGETFSFNDLLGALVSENGYVEAMALQGRVNVLTMGGGVTQVASALYVSVLAAELEILEWHSHPYAPGFAPVGLDAYVDAGKNFQFRNSNSTPIRICAEVVENELRIRIEGTDTGTIALRSPLRSKKPLNPASCTM